MGRGLVLVETQQIEREEHGQERRFRGEERAQAEPVGRQIFLQFFDPLFDRGPPVVIPSQFQRPFAAVGYPHPEV